LLKSIELAQIVIVILLRWFVYESKKVKKKTNERGIEWRNKKGKVIGQQVN